MPNVIDLFSGCGGLSKGFELAGFNVVGFVENWEPAIETYQENHPGCKLLGKDITRITDEEIREIKKSSNEIDGIIGGPPCQGFSTQGKRNPRDPRNRLFEHFLRFIKIVQPKFIIIENVKGLLGTKTPEEGKTIDVILNELKKIGYPSEYKVLLASNYGIPQKRERVFILGNRMGKKNSIELKKFNRIITVDEAIGNLPKLSNQNLGIPEKEFNIKISASWQAMISGTMQIDDFLSGKNIPTETSIDIKLTNHQIRNQREIDIERAKYVPEGRHLRSITPCGLKNDIFPYKRLHLKEGELKKQRYWRLNRKEVSETVITDWHAMRAKVHYSQLRPPSVREAARLQSFPDSFKFLGKINDQYKQIGNAVPVLLAYQLAKHIKATLLS